MLRNKRPRRTPNKGRFDPSNIKAGATIAVSLSVVATKLRVTCAQAVNVLGVPQYVATGGAHTGSALPTGMTYVSPTTFDLDYAANVAVDDTITIPDRELNVRNTQGGYVEGQVTTL